MALMFLLCATAPEVFVMGEALDEPTAGAQMLTSSADGRQLEPSAPTLKVLVIDVDVPS
jgi:hypothetical protein